MVYIYDTESYPNLFVAVFNKYNTKEYLTFIVWEDENGNIIIDHRRELLKFLRTKPRLVGFNNLKYDACILEFIIKNPVSSVADIKEYSNKAIESKWGLVPEWQQSTLQLDPFRINHYDNAKQFTSLKWLEFMYKLKSIKDLPFHHTKIIKIQSQVDRVVAYCKHDLIPTRILYEKSFTKIIRRQHMTERYGINLMNKPDSSLGETILMDALSKKLKISTRKLRKMKTQRDEIIVNDVIFDYYYNTPIVNKVINEYFGKIVMKSELSNNGNKIFNTDKISDYTYQWSDMKVVYAMGGIHGCVSKGIYKSNKDYMIMSCDVKAEYPHIIVENNLYPEHLGPQFVDVFRDDVVYKRKLYPKSTHFTDNQTYKLASNAAYGKMKSEYSGLYDPLCSTTIVVNGQLSKTMLGEMLTMGIPRSEILMMNTDGLEIKIPRKYRKLYDKICEKWEKITKLELEHTVYQKLIIDNVNNYIAFSSRGTVKRKGRFYIDEDYEKNEEWHKNGSATIIPEAIFHYFLSGTRPEATVRNCKDIFKFCYGTKKQKNFKYLLISADHSRKVTLKHNNDRVLRYYASTAKNAGSLFKQWEDGRKPTALQKDTLISFAQSIRSKSTSKHPFLNREWYIGEALKIIKEIENGRID